jgi:hypothetical protein
MINESLSGTLARTLLLGAYGAGCYASHCGESIAPTS